MHLHHEGHLRSLGHHHLAILPPHSGQSCPGKEIKHCNKLVIILNIVIFRKEFERAVIFRLGRLLPGARGPGVFFIVPCVDAYEIIDMRTQTFNVPAQEVCNSFKCIC